MKQIIRFITTHWNDLIVINLLTAILIFIILLFPSSIIRAIIGFPFILYFPGYTLTACLYPRKSELNGIVRLVLSFGLSIAIVGLVCLALNYTSWGIRLETILYSLSASIFILSVVTWSRQRRIWPEQRYGNRMLKISINWGKPAGEKALSIILVIVILGAVGTMVFALLTPKTGQTFTEFYILGADGTPNYPKQVKTGTNAEVLLGIVNHEAQTCVYSVAINVDGNKVNEVSPILLVAENKWENVISFALNNPGTEQKVEFILYKDGDSTPYMEPLRLWINATQ